MQDPHWAKGITADTWELFDIKEQPGTDYVATTTFRHNKCL